MQYFNIFNLSIQIEVCQIIRTMLHALLQMKQNVVVILTNTNFHHYFVQWSCQGIPLCCGISQSFMVVGPQELLFCLKFYTFVREGIAKTTMMEVKIQPFWLQTKTLVLIVFQH